jgi:hypothetical protein
MPSVGADNSEVKNWTVPIHASGLATEPLNDFCRFKTEILFGGPHTSLIQRNQLMAAGEVVVASVHRGPRAEKRSGVRLTPGSARAAPTVLASPIPERLIGAHNRGLGRLLPERIAMPKRGPNLFPIHRNSRGHSAAAQAARQNGNRLFESHSAMLSLIVQSLSSG